MSDLPPDLPLETRSTYQHYLTLPPASNSTLSNRVKNYLETLALASGENEFLDLRLAHQIGKTLLHLVEVVPAEKMPHVQAAISYFIESHDATPDLSSVLGFEDDAEVVNAVCRFTGHPDWTVAL